MPEELFANLTNILGTPPDDVQRLHGGMVGDVYLVRLRDGFQVVAKVEKTANPSLNIEGNMLTYLKMHSQLPVPDVTYNSPELLVMQHIEGSSAFNHSSQEHAADLLAALHSITNDYFGFPYDTLIGGLHQPNPPSESWIDFFREYRILHMAQVARSSGRLPESVYDRIEGFADQFEVYLIEPERPALIHGDVWTTNVLAQNGKITGLIDPAIYYGHPEVELAFIGLFRTFGATFYERYNEHNPIQDGFFQERLPIYNLYPLLVHVRLFGGGYVESVKETLRQFGF